MKLVIGLAASVALLGGCGEAVSVAQANQSYTEVAATTAAPPVTPDTAAAPSAATNASMPAPAAETEQEQTVDRTHRTGFDVLKTAFLASGEVDGARVTDMNLPDPCRIVFVTAQGETAADWSKVGNFAGRTRANRRSITIDDGSGVHEYSVAETSGATVESAFGTMAGECQS